MIICHTTEFPLGCPIPWVIWTHAFLPHGPDDRENIVFRKLAFLLFAS